MKVQHLRKIRDFIQKHLEEVGSNEGHDHYVYGRLAEDMTQAAALVYDGCMRGQEFMKREGSPGSATGGQ